MRGCACLILPIFMLALRAWGSWRVWLPHDLGWRGGVAIGGAGDDARIGAGRVEFVLFWDGNGSGGTLPGIIPKRRRRGHAGAGLFVL